MTVGGVLITIAFISKYALEGIVPYNIEIYKWTLIIASLIGVLPIALQAFQALKVKVVSIDLLVTFAVGGAFIISEFEESAIVTFLFLFGAYLEQRTLNKTRSAIKELTELAPESALLKNEDGEFEEVDVDDVDAGDILLIKTGAKVPVDGRVILGEGHINEASITGEPIPAEKEPGSFVYAGTILENGTLQVIADKVGEDTTFGKIIELVEEAQDSKSAAERFIDRFAKYYTPGVLIFALIVGIITRSMETAITILVLGCPGALVIGVPVSNVAGIGNGARHGVLLKGSEVIHDFSRIDTVVFDKTGTLTTGSPEVSDFFVVNSEEDTLVRDLLYSVERESDHPLAKAIVNHLEGSSFYPVTETDVIKGGGIVARVDNYRVVVGNSALMLKEDIEIDEHIKEKVLGFEKKGDSVVIIALDGIIKAVAGIRDQIRPGVKEELQRLKRLKIKSLVVLSGDNQGTVDLVASELGLTEAHGNMLPEDKAAYIKKLQKQGRVIAFVGDGVNDSPSIALANIGIAMGSGTDVAIETSDVVLMNSDFSKLPHGLGLAKATVRNMQQNIFIALGVVAVLLLSVFLSDWMNMSIGMLVHEGSILVVILNGMRLLRYKNKKLRR